MATTDTSTSNQADSNNMTGNGNWEFRDGQWQSSNGSTIGEGIPSGASNTEGGSAPSGGNPMTAGGGDGASGSGNPFASGGDAASGGNNPFASFIGGGNTSTTSEDGQYTYKYERPLDERALTDTNNPFNQLIGVLGGDTSALGGEGNPFAGGGSTPSGDTASSDSSNAPGNLPFGGGNNPFAGGSSTSSGDSNSASGGSGNPFGGGDIPGNLPFGDTPPSLETASSLPETGNGLPVPYNSEDWTSDIQTLDGANATGNTANGNGNWFYGSNNTADGNGNWYFSDGNTTTGNGNWYYSSGGTTNGNGNWNFGSDNTTDGNGNWNFGSGNDILGNANRPTGSDNDILGSGNTADVSSSSLLGNRIEASGDDKTLVGNEGWNFSVSGDTAGNLTSLGSSTPSQAIGFDIGTGVSSLLSSPDLVDSAMANPGYNNPDYTFDFGGVA